MKIVMMLAVLATWSLASTASAETVTSGKEHGIWHRFAAYDIGNVRPAPVVQPSPTTVRK